MNLLKISATAEIIPFFNASLSAGIEQWLWDFSAELPDKLFLNKLIPAKNLGANYVEVSFTLGIQTWALIIENADSNDTGFSYSIRGRSKSVLLAEPYSKQISQTWANTTAQAIVQELCNLVSISLQWDVVDWKIDNYVAEKRYPIDIINELVGDLGAKVQSLPEGTLSIIYYPAVSPDQLPLQTPDYELATDKNIFERSQQFINTRNYNTILVTQDSANNNNSQSVSIEEIEDGKDRLLKITSNPFQSQININHRSTGLVGMFDEGFYTEQLTEDVIIEDGKGQLSKNFDSLVSTKWEQDASGALTIAGDGKITCSGNDIGLVTITYLTRYLRYRFQRNSNTVKKTLVAVDQMEALTGDGGLSIEAIIGAGDNHAEPVIVKTLSTTEALLARAKSELWAQVYDVSEYSLQCAYQGTPVIPGNVAQVGVKREADTFNAWIKSVNISIGSDITQSITAVRPLND